MPAPLAVLLVVAACARPTAPLAPDGERAYPALHTEVLDDGPLRARLPPDDGADLVILYGGEQMGSMDTCGCPDRPRGGLARVDGYRSALERLDPDVPVVLLNVGNWLDDTIGTDERLRSDVVIANRWMLRGVEQGGWDVLNVGFRDLPHLVYETGAFPVGAVSANVRPTDPTVPAPARWRTVQAGTLRVAVTGVSPEGMTFLQPRGWTYTDEVIALSEVVPEMRKEADVVVVLGYAIGSRGNAITRVPGVDVLIEGAEYTNHYEPTLEGRAVWVRSHKQTMRLGELRLAVREGRIVAASDRHVDLDGAIPETRELLRTARDAAAEVQAAQEALFGTW